MKTSTAVTTLEPSAVSNRRQPVRQTRTNPSRNAANAARPFGGQGSVSEAQDNVNSAHGFFPAITHFTDSITALPKEMIRHYTMLKEVDAKIYGPEDALKQLVTAALKTPGPPRRKPTLPQPYFDNESQTGSILSAAGSFNDPSAPSGPAPGGSTMQSEAHAHLDNSDLPRRRLFHQLRMVMGETLIILDEKNHVMSTATDALEKQLARCDSSYPHIGGEISEEARYGNLSHWAYTHKTTEKKGTTAGERTRREAAATNNLVHTAAAIYEGDLAAIRSEARREAIAARKQRNQHVDSDFDDGRAAGQAGIRKTTGPGKGKKVADPVALTNGTSVGLGIVNGPSNAGANGPNKRRKIEKPAAGGGLTMERSMSGVYGPNAGAARGGAGSPRETPAIEAAKKRARGAAAVNGNGRRRANTNNSAINSPSMASSPVVGTFNLTKDQGNSPIPSTTQRSHPVRARQNSSQAVIQDVSRIRPSSSASNKHTNGNAVQNKQADLDKVAGLIGKTVGEIKNNMKEVVNTKGEHLIEDTGNGVGDFRGGIVVGSKGPDRSLKREDTDNGASKSRADRPPSISTSTRGGKPPKTATPVAASFSEPQRPRSSRVVETTAKRSHKKGAGLAAQLAAAAAAAEEEGSSIQGDEEEEEDDSEPRYCYCNQVSYGEMVACDSDQCKIEWFHLSCVGLSKAPTKNAKWYCEECSANIKKGKFATPGSR